MDVLDTRKDILRWYARLGYVQEGPAVDAVATMKSLDSELLVPACFLVLRKSLAV